MAGSRGQRTQGDRAAHRGKEAGQLKASPPPRPGLWLHTDQSTRVRAVWGELPERGRLHHPRAHTGQRAVWVLPAREEGL